jgi:hypothetical protein
MIPANPPKTIVMNTSGFIGDPRDGSCERGWQSSRDSGPCGRGGATRRAAGSPASPQCASVSKAASESCLERSLGQSARRSGRASISPRGRPDFAPAGAPVPARPGLLFQPGRMLTARFPPRGCGSLESVPLRAHRCRPARGRPSAAHPIRTRPSPHAVPRAEVARMGPRRQFDGRSSGCRSALDQSTLEARIRHMRREAVPKLDERPTVGADFAALRSSNATRRTQRIEPTRAPAAATSGKPRNPHTEESLSMPRLVVRPPFPGQRRRGAAEHGL